MNVLIIPKADFNKLRQSVPAFGGVFTELAERRAMAELPHSSTALSSGHPIPIPTPESELAPPPLTPTDDPGESVTLQR